jgi:hypothetical protein
MCWTVRNMRYAEMLDDLITAAKDCKMDVIALQEIRRDGKGEDDKVGRKEMRYTLKRWRTGQRLRVRHGFLGQ